MFNDASTSGFKSIEKVWLWLQNFVTFAKFFLKMFDMEILHKMLNYAFWKILAQQARKIDAAVSFSLYLLLKWT